MMLAGERGRVPNPQGARGADRACVGMNQQTCRQKPLRPRWAPCPLRGCFCCPSRRARPGSNRRRPRPGLAPPWASARRHAPPDRSQCLCRRGGRRRRRRTLPPCCALASEPLPRWTRCRWRCLCLRGGRRRRRRTPPPCCALASEPLPRWTGCRWRCLCLHYQRAFRGGCRGTRPSAPRECGAVRGSCCCAHPD